MYSWTAILKDGTILEEGKHEFKQVLNSNVDMFHLTDGEHNIAVDLNDGLFYINTFAFDTEVRAKEYRLIYFIRKRMDYTTGIGVSDSQHIHRYLIGWQTTINGENVQRIFLVDPVTHTLELSSKR